MSEGKQDIEHTTFAGLPALRVFDNSHTPSWQSRTEGRAELRAHGHPQAKWLSLILCEYPKEGRSRQTMLTLYEPAARALLEYLKTIYEPTKP